MRMLMKVNEQLSVQQVKSSKAMLIAVAALVSPLQSCWGGGGGSGATAAVNNAPIVGKPNIAISVLEWTTWTGNLNASLPSDPNGDAFSFNIVGAAPAGFTYNKNSWAYAYAAPLVTGNQITHVLFDVTDAKWATSPVRVDLAATSVDGPYDAPLTLSAITWPANAGMLNNVIFTVHANDLDGIQSALFSIVDANAIEVVTDAQLKANSVTTPTANGNKYDITLLAGLINTAWAYTLKTSFVGVNGGQTPSSQWTTATMTFNVVQDVPATAAYTGFTSTTTSISWNIACSDADGLTSCEYAITPSAQTTSPTTYVLFANKVWGAVNFTGLTAWSSYKVWTKITSLNASTNNPNFVTETSKVFTTNTLADTVPPVLSSTTQTFTTTVWTPWTLPTITANDAVDGVVPVVQTWTLPNFNVVWTYAVIYTATDAAWNSASITHTYIVNAVPDTVPPVLSSTTQTFTTTVWTPLTLPTITANDAVDGVVPVVQTWTLPNFNVVWTYAVTYTATDAAWNAASITHTYVVNAAPNTQPVITWITSTWSISASWNVTNIWLNIADNNLNQVTWTLSFTAPTGWTWTFSTTTWTWNTLNWISFTANPWWSGWTIKATIVDNWPGWVTQVVTIYAN